MSEAVIIAIITLVGGGTFGTVVAAFFSRRKTSAEADLTVGSAWEKFVLQQDRALEAVRREAESTKREAENARQETATLRGELDGANRRISVLERQGNQALMWQAQMLTRTEMTDDMLRRQGLEVPPIPPPPVIREPRTRAEDRD